MKKPDHSSTLGQLQPLGSAPNALIQLHDSRSSFLGRTILGRLLSDTRMNRAWGVLGQHISSPEEWKDFWREIVCALNAANSDSQLHPPNTRPQTKKKKEHQAMASNAEELANMIDGGPLDLRAYHLFPDEVMDILGVKNWSTLDRLQRSEAAAQLLREWPTVPELLREFANLARQTADEAVTKKKSPTRTTRDRKARYFSKTLSHYFSTNYSVNLYGTVSNIATVVLGYEVTKKLVENAIKGSQ